MVNAAERAASASAPPAVRTSRVFMVIASLPVVPRLHAILTHFRFRIELQQSLGPLDQRLRRAARGQTRPLNWPGIEHFLTANHLDARVRSVAGSLRHAL